MPALRTPVFNPATGQLELGDGANRYGTSGELLGDLPGGGGIARSQGYDPRYYEQYQRDTGDSGTETAWRLRQDVQDRMGDRIQVHQPGVVGRNADGSIVEGQGFNEVLDPSQVTWDDEFGWVMPRSNLSGSDPDDKARWDRIRMAAIAATLGGAAAAGGLLGTGAQGFMGVVPEVAAEGLAMPTLTPAFEGTLSSAPTITGGGAAASGGGALVGGGGGIGGGAGIGGSSIGDLASQAISRVGSGIGVTPSAGGSSMSWLTELLGGGGSGGGGILGDLLGGSDVLRLIGAAGGTLINGRQQGNLQDDAQAFARELQALQRNDVSGPFGTSTWARTQDGRWGNTRTLNPADQARLDQWRQLLAQSQQRQTQMNSSTPDFAGMAAATTPQSLGGQYAGGGQWINDNYDDIRRRLYGGR